MSKYVFYCSKMSLWIGNITTFSKTINRGLARKPGFLENFVACIQMFRAFNCQGHLLEIKHWLVCVSYIDKGYFRVLLQANIDKKYFRVLLQANINKGYFRVLLQANIDKGYFRVLLQANNNKGYFRGLLQANINKEYFRGLLQAYFNKGNF